MEGRAKTRLLHLIAGICFLIPALRYYYLQGFPGFGAPDADRPVVAAAQLLAGILFLAAFFLDLRKSRLKAGCPPSMQM
jgi:hypothetical protein